MLNLQKVIQPYRGQPLSQSILFDALSQYKWPHNKINDLVNQQMLTPVKRGLYIPGPELDLPTPSRFLLANHIYGPSYVSSETALAYWDLIPEKVTAIISMTTGNSKSFRTSLGRFIYTPIRLPYYCFGIQQVTITDRQVVLMASREKALCDKIITTKGLQLRSIRQTQAFLIEDLRIEKEALQDLNLNTISNWVTDAPKSESLRMLIKTISAL